MNAVDSFRDTPLQCFANIRLDSGEPVFVSVARSGVMVKKSRVGFFGRKLFVSGSADHAIRTAEALSMSFPEQKTPIGLNSLILKAYCNAILHCRSADEAERVLNEAGRRFL